MPRILLQSIFLAFGLGALSSCAPTAQGELAVSPQKYERGRTIQASATKTTYVSVRYPASTFIPSLSVRNNYVSEPSLTYDEVIAIENKLKDPKVNGVLPEHVLSSNTVYGYLKMVSIDPSTTKVDLVAAKIVRVVSELQVDKDRRQYSYSFSDQLDLTFRIDPMPGKKLVFYDIDLQAGNDKPKSMILGVAEAKE